MWAGELVLRVCCCVQQQLAWLQLVVVLGCVLQRVMHWQMHFWCCVVVGMRAQGRLGQGRLVCWHQGVLLHLCLLPFHQWHP